jgi:hypothetical protein
MDTPSKNPTNQHQNEAAEHIASAHKILKTLEEKVGDHPELGSAITKLEMALNILAVQTGGML